MQDVIEAVSQAGGRALIVGGAVRAKVMGRVPKDIDLEVYGLSGDALSAALLPLGRVNAVGVSFGVLKLELNNSEGNISLPSVRIRRAGVTGLSYRHRPPDDAR